MNNFNNNPNNFGMNQFNNINLDNFWFNQMNNIMFNNMFNNNMNQFFGFSVNPNMQQNFSNFGGLNVGGSPLFNMNNMNMNNMNMNNLNNAFNNMNINGNTPLRKINSEEINKKMSINDPNAEIQINIRFMTAQSFKIKAKLKEKLINVINRFKNKECPQELKNSLSVVIKNGNQIKDLNKTLLDLNFTDGEPLLLMNNQTPKEENKEEEKEKEYVLTEREKEQTLKLRQKYEEKYLNNKNTNDDEGENKIPSFIHFVLQEDKQLGVTVKEHKHKLIYCLTNISWKCNSCNLKYKKEIGKYYCSLCDYSMCESCHYQKKYFMKKSFRKGTKPSNESVNVHFFDTDLHEHRLVYCRSSRHFAYFNEWNCDNCGETFENKIWSFYCTLCDFDLCADCCGFH